jgi:fucose permease
LSILYIFIGLGSLISSAIVKKIGIKNALFIGALGHLIFVVSQILPAWTADNPIN